MRNIYNLQPYRRNTDERWERLMYQRDWRINGNVYKGNVSLSKNNKWHSNIINIIILGSRIYP